MGVLEIAANYQNRIDRELRHLRRGEIDPETGELKDIGSLTVFNTPVSCLNLLLERDDISRTKTHLIIPQSNMVGEQSYCVITHYKKRES